jgi:hypothetical protein
MQRLGVLLVAALIAVCGVGSVSAEPPSWTEMADPVYVLRAGSFWQPDEENTLGIWALDLDSWELERRRSYVLFAGRWGSTWPSSGGQGTYLTTAGDRLIGQTWPYVAEFEAPTFRWIRRYAPLGGAYPKGWTLIGPVIEGHPTIPDGTYGFPFCIMPLVNNYRPCEPAELPSVTGESQVLEQGDTSQVLWSSSDGLTAVGEVAPHDGGRYFRQTFAFDRQANGFWRGEDHQVSFHPIEDGLLNAATEMFEVSEFGGGELRLRLLTVHPLRGEFLVGGGRGESYFARMTFGFEPVAIAPAVPSGTPRNRHIVSAAAFGAPPQHHEQTIPIVAEAPGREGTWWHTDLWLYNPSPSPTTLEIRRVSAPAHRRTLQLPGHGSRRIPNALAWIGGGPGGDGQRHDALVVESDYRWCENVVAAARIWTRAGAGTVGHAVPAVPGTIGYSNHIPDRGYILEWREQVPYFVVDRRVPGRYRHNLGIVNDSDEPLTLELMWGAWAFDELQGDVAAPEENTQTVTVGARSVIVTSLEELFPTGVVEGYVPRVTVTGARPAALWLSMIDNDSGDATFVPFSCFSQDTDRDVRHAIPAVAHHPGSGGARWSTDLYGIPVETDWWEDSPSVVFHTQAGSSSSDVPALVEAVVPMPLADWMETIEEVSGVEPSPEYAAYGFRAIVPDVVAAVTGDDGAAQGALEVRTASWTASYSRTYTPGPNGGTVGGMLPLYPHGGWPIQHLAGIEVGNQYRINIGLFNGSHERPVTHRLTLWSADGELAATAELTLDPLTSRIERLADVFGLGTGDLPSGTYGLTVLPLDEPGTGVQGRSWAFVSLIDDQTNDPTNMW